MLAMLALAIQAVQPQATPRTLANYYRALERAPVVHVMWEERRAGRWRGRQYGEAWVSGGKRYQMRIEDDLEAIWDGKRGIQLSHRARTWKPLGSAAEFGSLSFMGAYGLMEPRFEPSAQQWAYSEAMVTEDDGTQLHEVTLKAVWGVDAEREVRWYFHPNRSTLLRMSVADTTIAGLSERRFELLQTRSLPRMKKELFDTAPPSGYRPKPAA